jgi:hypothetical protein
MTSFLPGLIIRYVLVLIGAQFALFLLALVLDAFGWGDSLSSAANVAVLIAAGSSAGSFVAQRMKGRPGWGVSLKLSALLAVIAVVLGSLMLFGMALLSGMTAAELQLLAAEMGMTPVTALLVLAGLSLVLSYPVTIAGFRIGAGATAKQIEKQAALTGI